MLSTFRSVPTRPGLGVALAFLLTGSVLSGCLVSALSGDGITAKDAATRADARARAWNSDAYLLAVLAVENRNDTSGEDADADLHVPPDTVVGDGRAPAWLTMHYSPQGHRFAFYVVFANGTVESFEKQTRVHVQFAALRTAQALGLALPGDPAEDPRPAKGPPGIVRWEVDSTRAMEVARTFGPAAALLQAPDAVDAMVLAMGTAGPSPGPVWLMAIASPAQQRGALLAVDATSGALRSSKEVPLDETDEVGATPGTPGTPGAGAGSEPLPFTFEGTVTPEQPEAVHDFDVPEGYRMLEVRGFSTSSWLSTDGAALSFRDPQGEDLGTVQDGDELPLRGPGTYEAVVTFTSDLPIPVGGPVRGVDYHVAFDVR